MRDYIFLFSNISIIHIRQTWIGLHK